MSRHEAAALPAATLVLGGARSGKSRYAECLVEAAATAGTYCATAEAGDSEMAARIAAHRQRRSLFWRTVEAPLAVPAAIAAEACAGRPLLVDCLTLWLSNVMLAGRPVETETAALRAALREAAGPVVLVANEVGLGLVPETPLGREFRDDAGRLNQAVAALADRVVFIAAGLPLILKDNAVSSRSFERGVQMRRRVAAPEETAEAEIVLLAPNRAKPPAARRVAIVLAEGSDDDGPPAAARLISALRRAGYRVDDAPPDGAALAARLGAGPSSARPQADGEESLSFATYSAFLAALPMALQKRLAAQWGAAERDPFFRPGRLDCGRFAIPGCRCGNLAVLVPPTLGTAAMPPHAGIAAYAWLADEFRADAVVDLGPHGMPDWLPSAGPSERLPETAVVERLGALMEP